MTGSQRTGPLTRIPAGWKFTFLFAASLGLYAVADLAVQITVFALAVTTAWLTRTPFARLARMLAGLVLIVGIVFLTLGFTTTWEAAGISALRLLSLCLFAYAVSLSTTFSQMLALFERLLAPTRHLGLNPAQMSLALSMTIRFIPQIRTQYLEVREAQFARGRVPAAAGGRAGGLQFVRVEARQSRGDDPWHVRQRPAAESVGARHRGRGHHPLPEW